MGIKNYEYENFQANDDKRESNVNNNQGLINNYHFVIPQLPKI
jgi:hypothetical protein